MRMLSLLLLMTSRSPVSNGGTQLVKLCMDLPSSGWAAECFAGWVQAMHLLSQGMDLERIPGAGVDRHLVAGAQMRSGGQ